MSSSETFYWHDYETFGADPSFDRPVQFAGQRTDLDLNPIGEPLVIYARPPRDYLPQPAACLITGITPQIAAEHGIREADFIDEIVGELSVPGTCGVGYNSLRFDDTVTRFTLWRSLRSPYEREFGQGRSRWDLIDALRTAHALRPEGIRWPEREDGAISFRLEDLAAANNLAEGAAHDALVDVRTTIAMARLLRQVQPRLFAYLFEHRQKAAVQRLVNVESAEPLLHVSGMFGAKRNNLGLILPVGWHSSNKNELICVDLAKDAHLLLDLSIDELRGRLYSPSDRLAEDEERPGIKSVHINRCPVLLPPKMADKNVAERAALDLEINRKNLLVLRDHLHKHPGALRDKLREVLVREDSGTPSDVDIALYSGGFLADTDRQTLDRVVAASAEVLSASTFAFEDPRLDELVFRYRARNYPESLSDGERAQWAEHCFTRLSEDEGPGLGLESFHAELDQRMQDLGEDEKAHKILMDLQSWGDELLS
ncbi:MAG: exodeoxyribonuclease I [Pseudomonadota bacterium]